MASDEMSFKNVDDDDDGRRRTDRRTDDGCLPIL